MEAEAVQGEEGVIEVDGISLFYRAMGTGEPVLLLHGWPTSSHLWRRVMPALATHRRAIALDLPGFGRSDKPLDRRYDGPFFERCISGFLDALDIERTGLVVHDLGGPVGLYWASQNPERLERLALLNTIVYPELSPMVRAFLAACRTPGIRRLLTSPWGLRRGLRYGVADSKRLDADAIPGLLEPFTTDAAREALVRTALDLSTKDLELVARWLPNVDVPVCMIYGARDWVLPDVAKTARRIQQDIPKAQVTEFPDCGHFLQEERPEALGEQLAEFFA